MLKSIVKYISFVQSTQTVLSSRLKLFTMPILSRATNTCHLTGRAQTYHVYELGYKVLFVVVEGLFVVVRGLFVVVKRVVCCC
jgi:hypothetical protein